MFAQLLTPFHSAEKRKVLDAINTLGLKVSPSDVSLKEGMPLHLVTCKLNEIATETNATLKVSSTGTIEYVFQPNFEMQYVSNAARNVWLGIWRVLVNISMMAARVLHLILITLFRISIGIILIASVVAVVVLVIVVVIRLFAGSSDSSDGFGASDISGDNAGGSMDGIMYGAFALVRYFLFDWIFDWWLWGRYYCNPYYGSRYSWWSPWYSPYDAYYGGGRHYYYDDNEWVDPFFSKDSKKDSSNNEQM